MRAAHHLGVDVGGTKVAFRVETADGCLEETAFFWAPRAGTPGEPAEPGEPPGVGRDLARLADHVARLRARIGAPPRAVGVAMPGTVGPDGRITAWPSRPEWAGLDLGAVLRGLFPDSAVAWADDGDLGALAEARAADCDDLLYLGIGTGVGGGLVLDGALCPGPGRGSFEIGHLIIALDGAPCVCGRRGCLQGIASGPATLRRAALARGSDVAVGELAPALRDGRPWAVGAVDRTCRALAAAVIGVQELVHPRRVLIGGGFAAGLPGLVESVSEQVAALARPGQAPLPVGPAVLGALSSLRGAVLLARQIAA